MVKSKASIGVIGCGSVSGIYLKRSKLFKNFEIVACADIDIERARNQAIEYNLPKVYSVSELLADSDIQIILNLTPPVSHAEISLAAIKAGKSVYSEKPLAVNIDDGFKILDEARKRSVCIGCAPDTFLGGGLQTCRKIIDDNLIGQPIAAIALMMNHGHENWHPDPENFYLTGGGPMFDMGPYYISALVTMFGPAQRVTGSTKISFPERVIFSYPKNSKIIKVDTPTHATGVIDFANGVTATVITSFDVWTSKESVFEIYGTEGTLRLPDPDTFGGPVCIWKHNSNKWEDIPIMHGYTDKNYRGLGLADMVNALQLNRPHRADGELAYHVLEVMCAFNESSYQNRHIEISSTYTIPAPLPTIDPLNC